ncbi:MAG TPA: riboflavin synthase [Edaphocola sp.]|nr:riboflavin synthase [Edaphocola sp.]
MFTGIIKNIGVLHAVEHEGTNLHLTVRSELAKIVNIDQSVAHDGVCLTVVNKSDTDYTVTVVQETLNKTTIGSWQAGRKINLELAMMLGERLDGHIVQGHVDGTGICTAIEAQEGSHLLSFSFPPQFAALIIEKGSICINGVSLTAFNVGADNFQVAVIPYTFNHTGFQYMQVGDAVNLEFDILGKYFLRKQSLEG